MTLGKYTKEQVRTIARQLELPVAKRSESQELCFIPDNDYNRFLHERIPELIKPGPILDRSENVLGWHNGAQFYTIGQRKGLGIALGFPLYVIKIIPERNAIVVGKNEDLFQREFIAERVNLIDRDGITEPIRATVKVQLRRTKWKELETFQLCYKLVLKIMKNR